MKKFLILTFSILLLAVTASAISYLADFRIEEKIALKKGYTTIIYQDQTLYQNQMINWEYDENYEAKKIRLPRSDREYMQRNDINKVGVRRILIDGMDLYYFLSIESENSSPLYENVPFPGIYNWDTDELVASFCGEAPRGVFQQDNCIYYISGDEKFIYNHFITYYEHHLKLPKYMKLNIGNAETVEITKDEYEEGYYQIEPSELTLEDTNKDVWERIRYDYYVQLHFLSRPIIDFFGQEKFDKLGYYGSYFTYNNTVYFINEWIVYRINEDYTIDKVGRVMREYNCLFLSGNCLYYAYGKMKDKTVGLPIGDPQFEVYIIYNYASFNLDTYETKAMTRSEFDNFYNEIKRGMIQ